MTKIKRINIQGFRGILAPLPLDLTKNGQPSSAVIFGRNGTGKSSVTDAWEWLLTGKVAHLGREGAGPSSYPHFSAERDKTVVSVTLSGNAGVVSAQYDSDRITRPRVSGDFEGLRSLTPHPCHIRFADLAQFVFMTKTERYDLLTQFMGLSRQIEVQKALRRTQRQFREYLDALELKYRDLETRLTAKIGGPCTTLSEVVGTLRPRLERHSLGMPASLEELQVADARLRDMVAADPRAAAIAQLGQLRDLLPQIGTARPSIDALARLSTEAQPFADLAEQLRGLALLALLEAGRAAVEASGATDMCPLCGQSYTGNLATHLDTELASLRALKEEHARTAAALKSARSSVRGTTILPQSLVALVPQVAIEALRPLLSELLTAGTRLQERIDAVEGALPKHVEDISAGHLKQCTADVQVLSAAQEALEVASGASAAGIQELLAKLQTDDSRRQLVEDFELIHAAFDGLPQLVDARTIAQRSRSIAVALDDDTEDYVRACVEDVQRRFSQISTDVAQYFAVLEELTPGLAKPALRVLEDQDRSVVFEVELHGQLASPAYKYLSESQMNSFGLAVFLASVRRFNPAFGFLILDDVVNSLDGHKRPQLLKLLRLHFADRQVLLLTHDSSWRDRIARELPQWKRFHFQRHEPGIGPVVADPPTSLDLVRENLLRDQPKVAGQILGPLIEDELQDLAEALEAELKFNRRNEYTLEPLLSGVRKRLESKLKAAHPAATSAKDLSENAGFRNLCAHAKNPAIAITTEEVQLAVDAWLAFSTHLRCPKAECSEALRWADPDFRCGCGATTLQRA